MIMIKEFFGEEYVDEQEGNLHIVKLKDFVLKDEEGRSKVIKGMYLSFRYKFEDFHYLYDLMGIRSKLSNTENQARFVHPHLPTKTLDDMTWEKFCLGYGSFGVQVSQVENGVDSDEFRAFLMHLTYFLSYEDNSNPYTYLRNAIALKEPDRAPRSLSRLGRLEKLELVKELQFNPDYSLKENHHNHKILMACYSHLPKCIYLNGSYYKHSRFLEADFTPKELFIFKGKKVWTSSYREENSVQVSEEDLRFNPYLFKSISNFIQQQIRDEKATEFFASTGDEQKVQINNIREMYGADKISLLKNL